LPTKLWSGPGLLPKAVTNILRNYLDTFYRRRRERWETEVMEYRPLDENDPNLAFNRDRLSERKAAYIVQVRRSDKDLMEAIQKLLEDAERLYKQKNGKLPRIYFDRHLYLQKGGQVQNHPPGPQRGRSPLHP
jgi:hypothetical protein